MTSSFQQELKSIRERYTYPTSLASEDYYYSDLDKITPTGVVSVYDDSHNKVGEYGYVDLGLLSGQTLIWVLRPHYQVRS